MFVRATTINADPARLDEGIAFVKDNVVPAVNTLPGSLGLSMFVDRDSGTTTVTTAWETEKSRADADAVLTPLRAKGWPGGCRTCRSPSGGKSLRPTS